MYRAHRIYMLLLLQGCSMNASGGKARVLDASANDDAASAAPTGDDAGDSAADASKAPETAPDAGGVVDSGHASADAGVNPLADAGALPPLGPYTTADLPEAAWQTNKFCGSVSLFQTRWPQEELGDPSCPQWLTQTGVFELTRDTGHGNGSPYPCSWRGEPEGVVFSAGGIPTERAVYVGWSPNPTQLRNLTVVWRGLLCTYKAGSEL